MQSCPNCNICMVDDQAPTLRDRFAMAALTGLLAFNSDYVDRAFVIDSAFKYADEAMAARKKGA